MLVSVTKKRYCKSCKVRLKAERSTRQFCSVACKQKAYRNRKKSVAYFRTGRDDWETPPDFFDKLNQEFGFTLDVCAAEPTAKCDRYFTKRRRGRG